MKILKAMRNWFVLPPPIAVKGTVDKFEIVDSVVQRYVFGLEEARFQVNSDEPIAIGGGKTLSKIPLRFESGGRPPNLESLLIEVVGVYDPYENILLANTICVDQIQLRAGAYRRLAWGTSLLVILGYWLLWNALSALGLFVLVKAVAETAHGVSLVLSYEALDACFAGPEVLACVFSPLSTVQWGVFIAVVVALVCLSVVFSIFSLWILRVPVLSLIRQFLKWVRRWTEYSKT